jgi:hypothetical protein
VGLKSNVVNLGCAGHDPYDSWFRLKYYEDYLGLEVQDVILVLETPYTSWLSRHPTPLVFEKPDFFGCENTSLGSKLQVYLRNSSSFIELMAQLMRLSDKENENEAPMPLDSMSQIAADPLSQEMIDCLLTYQSSYPRFLVVSISSDSNFNQSLSEFCIGQSICCRIENLRKPEYLLDGIGHLNIKGNQALGRLMTQAYIEAFKGE